MSRESAAPAPAEFHCTQCGGVLHPDEGQSFLECPFCGSSVYLDRSGVAFHWALRRTLSPADAEAALRRWMASNDTVKDLDRKSHIVSTTFQYFPLLYVKERDAATGRENVFVELAAATSISELKRLDIPSGDLQKYDPALDAEAVTPSVPLSAMLSWLQPRGVEVHEVAEAAIVHVPVTIFKYRFGNQTYTAMVEGASGQVIANIFPAKAEMPYVAVTALATAGFLILSAVPLIGRIVSGDAGLWVGAAVCLVAGGLFAAFVFILAAVVSAKV